MIRFSSVINLFEDSKIALEQTRAIVKRTSLHKLQNITDEFIKQKDIITPQTILTIKIIKKEANETLSKKIFSRKRA